MSDANLKTVSEHFLNSPDFNGIPLMGLSTGKDHVEVADNLKELLREDQIDIIFEDTDANPHIIRIGVEPKRVQIEKLNSIKPGDKVGQHCVYPSKNHLRKIVDPSRYKGKPYLLRLALGDPQISYKVFDLSVLEFYRNDPRFYCDNDDIRGHIYLRQEYAEKGETHERDQIYLQGFGFCYDDQLNRAVAVFTKDLATLSEEHQRIWEAKELQGDYKLHPDYYQNTILGNWGEGISIFDAFIMELQIINKISLAINRPQLFLNDFSTSKPTEFSFLIRPTSKELNSFILTLDKMISDNLSPSFFKGDIALDEEIPRGNKKVEVRRKGTIRLLEEWLVKHFRPKDPKPLDDMLKVFKKVRVLRQKPAHAIQDNYFDQNIFREQRDLIIEAYDGIRTLRLALQNHPLAKNIKVDPILNGIIWTY